MKGRAATAFLLALLAAATLAAQETTAVIRVYSLKHLSVTDVLFFVQPLLSPGGDLRVSARNQFQVKDVPDRQRLVEQMVASLDVAPSSYRIAVKFIEASQAPPAGTVREEVAGIGAQLKGLIPYASYEIIEQLVIEGTPGDRISYRLGKDYQVEFNLRRVLQHPQMVQLSGMGLFRVKVISEGQERLTPILRTTLNLTVGQTHVLGVSSSQGGAKALVMVFQAEKQ